MLQTCEVFEGSAHEITLFICIFFIIKPITLMQY